MRTKLILILLIISAACGSPSSSEIDEIPFAKERSIILTQDGEVFYYDPNDLKKWGYQPGVVEYDSKLAQMYPTDYDSRALLFSNMGWQPIISKDEATQLEMLFEPFYSEYEQNDDIDATLSDLILVATSSCNFGVERKLRELNQGSKTIRKVFNRKQALEAKAFGILNLNLSKGEFVSLVDYAQFRNHNCSNKDFMLYAGVRLRFDSKEIKGKFGLDMPNKLAAAAELDLAKISVTLETIGWANAQSRQLIANWINIPLNVENLEKINKVVADLLKIMKDDMNVMPISVPIELASN